MKSSKAARERDAPGQPLSCWDVEPHVLKNLSPPTDAA